MSSNYNHYHLTIARSYVKYKKLYTVHQKFKNIGDIEVIKHQARMQMCQELFAKFKKEHGFDNPQMLLDFHQGNIL